jgi:transposase
VEIAVEWGREHRDRNGIHSIGVEEIAWRRWHTYLTLIYQIDDRCKRLPWIGEKRTVKTLLCFFHWLGRERSQQLKHICSDMWKPYLAMKTVAPVLRNHRPLLLKWLRAMRQFSSAIIEGFNTRAKLATRKAYGFRTHHAAEIALFHALAAFHYQESAMKFSGDASSMID